MKKPMIGRLSTTHIESELLRGNRLGDPHVRELITYLPPGYGEDNRRYPTVMVLPGFGSNARSMVGYDIWKPNLAERFDQLLNTGACPPAILVLPDAVTRWGGSQFLDSTATGRYQTYLAEEVVAHVDQAYQTIPKREARAVVGRSSGGFGALRLGMDRPEVFSVLGSHAGDAAFEVSLRPMFMAAAVAFVQAGGVGPFLERVTAEGPKGRDYDPLFFVAAAAAYAPEPEAELPHAAMPFELETGQPIDSIWARWLEQDPVRRAARSADALRRMRLVYVDAGRSDEYGLQLAARQLARAFSAIGRVTLHFEEFEGGHRGTSYRYDDSLPKIVSALVGD